MGKLKTYQEQVQETLVKALKAAEDQHRNLAAKPFDYAEKLELEAKELSIKTIRNAHDKALDNMYSALNGWNKRVIELTSDLVAKFEKEEDKKAPAKKDAKTVENKVEEAIA